MILLQLLRTQTSLCRWKCARKRRREGDNGPRPPSVPFPWSLAVHHQPLLYLAKNEAPEEEAVATAFKQLSCASSLIPINPAFNLKPFHNTEILTWLLWLFEILNLKKRNLFYQLISLSKKSETAFVVSITRDRGARWKVGGLTIENNFFILKIEKRNKDSLQEKTRLQC